MMQAVSTEQGVDMEENEGVEAVESTEEKAKGRPRPSATIELDAKVLEAITGAGEAGVTKAQLSEQVGQPENKIYLALYRLSHGDAIHRTREGRTTLWKAGTKPEAPVTEEAPAEV